MKRIKSIHFIHDKILAYTPYKMNQPTNAVKIIDLSKRFSKKDIKRELKANGFGSVDIIVFEKYIYTEDYHTALVWFRPTKKPFVIETRRFLTERFEKNKRGIVSIPVRCAKTPEVEHNEKWCLTENKSIRPDDMVGRITELERKLNRQEDIIYQLIGGLFHQTKQRDTLEYWVDTLFDRPHTTPSSNQEGDNWPTTRQGDELEVEVKGLKKAMSHLEDKLKRLARPHRRIIVDTESDDQCVA
jgi:uncharacterized coiled-coil protein SlyX